MRSTGQTGPQPSICLLSLSPSPQQHSLARKTIFLLFTLSFFLSIQNHNAPGVSFNEGCSKRSLGDRRLIESFLRDVLASGKRHEYPSASIYAATLTGGSICILCIGGRGKQRGFYGLLVVFINPPAPASPQSAIAGARGSCAHLARSIATTLRVF